MVISDSESSSELQYTLMNCTVTELGTAVFLATGCLANVVARHALMLHVITKTSSKWQLTCGGSGGVESGPSPCRMQQLSYLEQLCVGWKESADMLESTVTLAGWVYAAFLQQFSDTNVSALVRSIDPKGLLEIEKVQG